MTSSVKTVYKCDFCPKKRYTKKAMENHEKFCKSNPENWHDCLMCSNLEKEKVGKETIFTCKLLKQNLYSYVAEKKKLLTKHPQSFKNLIRMPTECEVKNMDDEAYAEYLRNTPLQKWLRK